MNIKTTTVKLQNACKNYVWRKVGPQQGEWSAGLHWKRQKSTFYIIKKEFLRRLKKMRTNLTGGNVGLKQRSIYEFRGGTVEERSWLDCGASCSKSVKGVRIGSKEERGKNEGSISENKTRSKMWSKSHECLTSHFSLLHRWQDTLARGIRKSRRNRTEVNARVRLVASCISRKVEEEIVVNAFRKPIGPSAPAYRGKLVGERK